MEQTTRVFQKTSRGSEFGRLSLAGEFFHGGGWVWIPRISQKSGETGMMPELATIFEQIWVWVNTYRYIFSGMNIHLPAILRFIRGTRVLTHPQLFRCAKHFLLLKYERHERHDVTMRQVGKRIEEIEEERGQLVGTRGTCGVMIMILIHIHTHIHIHTYIYICICIYYIRLWYHTHTY